MPKPIDKLKPHPLSGATLAMHTENYQVIDPAHCCATCIYLTPHKPDEDHRTCMLKHSPISQPKDSHMFFYRVCDKWVSKWANSSRIPQLREEYAKRGKATPIPLKKVQYDE